MLLSHRSSDALIAVYQDNSAQQVTIHDLNAVAENMLGYRKQDLIGQPIGALLPERIYSLLKEYVEYEAYGNDVGNVLSKVSSFCVVDKDKKEHAFQIKVQRSTPVDGHDQFNLILQTQQDNRRNEAFRALLKENFKGHEVLDDATGLPDRTSLLKNVELVMFYVNKKELTSSFALVELDDMQMHHDAYGDSGIAEIMRHIAALCRQNLRGDDSVGILDTGRLGLILFDATDDAAKMVLNRIRWLIAANSCPMNANGMAGELASLSIRVSYTTLEAGKTDIPQMLSSMEASLDNGDISPNRVQKSNNNE